jgi:UDP-GlcNAc3NAcA epimerase
VKITTVVGARPQFIKAATVSRALAQLHHVTEILVHTGQHYDWNMSGIFFQELALRSPDHHLNVGSGWHGEQTGAMLARIEGVLKIDIPDCVLVYGDTNSTLAGALAAAKLHIPVAHVEAGLRSFNRHMPEEINRIVTDHVCELLFAPTDAAIENLRREGLVDRAYRSGDVMYDAALLYASIAEQRSECLSRLKLTPKQYCLATVHRAENTDDPVVLGRILAGLSEIAKELPVIFPVHPRTRSMLSEYNFQRLPNRVWLIEPLGYLDMIMAEKHARLIATDSGGVQKESYFFRVPCITLRNESEWVELIELGYNFLAGTDASRIAATAMSALDANPDWNHLLYGNGNASNQIATEILAHFEKSGRDRRKELKHNTANFRGARAPLKELKCQEA